MLDEFGAYPAVIARELDRYLPFLATTKVLIGGGPPGRRPGGRARGDQGARGRRGAGDAREGRCDNDLFDRLAADARLGLSRAEIDALVADRTASSARPRPRSPRSPAGSPRWSAHPQAATYSPAPIL